MLGCLPTTLIRIRTAKFTKLLVHYIASHLMFNLALFIFYFNVPITEMVKFINLNRVAPLNKLEKYFLYNTLDNLIFYGEKKFTLVNFYKHLYFFILGSFRESSTSHIRNNSMFAQSNTRCSVSGPPPADAR